MSKTVASFEYNTQEKLLKEVSIKGHVVLDQHVKLSLANTRLMVEAIKDAYKAGHADALVDVITSIEQIK